jgi:hypothetical protein
MRRLLPYLLTWIVLIALIAPAYDHRPGGSVRPFHVERSGRSAQAAFHVKPYLQLPAPDGMTIMWETTEPLPGLVEYGPTEALGMVKHETRPGRLHQVRLSGLRPGTRYCYRVRSGELVSAISTFRTAPPPGTGRWRLALYGDSRSNPPIHRLVVEQIARHDVDLILHTGDIVLNGKNYELWRREFFDPLAPIAGSVPWVSTIGNHEADAANYFSYVALPGNERYYGFDYANAHIVCLDSNGWIEKGRDSPQYQWMERHLKAPRTATWTFVAFHHPLFSAHARRPINSLRWDWAPLFLDPECRVDGVLTGHDHFYARNYRMGRTGPGPSHDVLFLTSAGGGAWLYPTRQRDYVAATRAVHHFTLFAFDGDTVTISAIDTAGTVFDRYTLTKGSAAADERCAYEVEELRETLRRTLARMPAVEVAGDRPTMIDTVLEVPHRFAVPLAGRFLWQDAPGWQLAASEVPFTLQPGEPLRIPLQARVETRGLAASPRLVIEFAPGKFVNRRVEVYPFKLTGPARVRVASAGGFRIDGRPDEPAWQSASPLHLLAAGGEAKASEPGQVRLAADGRHLCVSAHLRDFGTKVAVVPPSADQQPSKLVLSSEHIRIELSDGKQVAVFALSAENIPYHAVDDRERSVAWPAAAAPADGGWTVEAAVPLHLFPNRDRLRVNIVHRSKQTGREYQMRPTFALGPDPDLIPDWKAASSPDRFAHILWE